MSDQRCECGVVLNVSDAPKSYRRKDAMQRHWGTKTHAKRMAKKARMESVILDRERMLNRMALATLQ